MGRRTLTGPATAYIAGEFRAARARHKITMDALVKHTGLAKGTVNSALVGTSALAVEAYLLLCEPLGLDAGRLIEDALPLATEMPGQDDFDLAANTSEHPTDRERFDQAHPADGYA